MTSTLPRWEHDSEPRFVLDLASALSDRFEVTILAPMADGAAEFETINAVAIRRYRYALFRKWERLASPGAIMPNLRQSRWLYALIPSLIVAQFVATLTLLKRERFDVVHCHWLIPQGFVLALASLFMRVPPALLTCHGGDAFTLDSVPFRRLKAWVIGRLAAVTAVSHEIADKLKELAPDSVSPIHIPMGVDLNQFSQLRPAQTSEQTILYAGRLAPKKGVKDLIKAVSDHGLRHRNVRVRMVGGGPLLHALREFATQLNLSDEMVVFTGPMPHDQLAKEMQAATLFCAPFVIADDGDREGMPTVLLEAAAAELPIITTDVGGCGDLIENGESGWLLRPGDVPALTAAIKQALDQPDKARQFARCARDRANDYSWPTIAAQYAAILEHLLANPPEDNIGS